MYIEKYIEEPHHIEFQVLGDSYGNVIHLYDRECSVQRRHQKIVEESPSPFLTPELRERMGRTAVEAARSVGYVGAGTIEFLVDGDRNYYFLEMNTRLQVEHPVTEEVLGLDLVKEQIYVASGMELRYRQSDIFQRCHAIECRICAEDVDDGFMPSPGMVRQVTEPNGLGVRVDGYIYEGYDVPMWYDPMISKLIVRATTRGYAIERMRAALDEYKITGIKTNISYLNAIMNIPDFVRGTYDTSFLDKNGDAINAFRKEKCPEDADRRLVEDMAMIAAMVDYLVMQEEGGGRNITAGPSGTLNRWREFGKRKNILGI